MRTLQEKLTDEIDHAIHQRSVLEDSNLAKEILMAVDRYTSARYGIRPLSGLIATEGLTWVGKFTSMKNLDREDSQRSGL